MIGLCTYSIDKCDSEEIIGVISNHGRGVLLKEGKWEILQSSKRKSPKEIPSRKKPRGPLAIYADIINVAKAGAPKSRIVEKANTNFLKFERILNCMYEHGLLVCKKDSPRLLYATQKGNEFLKKYRELQEMLPEQNGGVRAI